MRNIILLLMLFFCQGALGEGLKISVRLDAASGQQVLLAHYYGETIYVDDTIRTDLQGKGIFRRDTLLPEGLYKIYLDKDRHFDFLLGADQELSIANRDFTLSSLEIDGASESEEFLSYMKWLRKQQEKIAFIDSTLKNAGESEKENYQKKIRDLTEEVNDYWKNKSAEYPGTLLASFLMANYFEDVTPEDIPDEFSKNDSLKWLYQYEHRKNHFLDHLNFSDERLLNTPLVKSRLDSYFGKILLQFYDSVKSPVYTLLKKVEPYPRMFRFVTSHFLNSSLNSRVMGMDALFVDLARDYYYSGKANWADSTTMAKIRENVIFIENNLIGKQARDFTMETFDGHPFRLYQQNSRYTILAFYEPNCGHCKEYIPKLYDEVYLPFRDKGVEFVAVYTLRNKKEWGDFIALHHLNDWVNVWDENHLTRFKINYDTRTTPALYLLDKDKKIIAKKFSLEFIKNYLKLNLEKGIQGI